MGASDLKKGLYIVSFEEEVELVKSRRDGNLEWVHKVKFDGSCILLLLSKKIFVFLGARACSLNASADVPVYKLRMVLYLFSLEFPIGIFVFTL